MQTQEHLRRAESFERSAGKLDPIEDTELYVVFMMRAGTNRVNAALHAMGVTDVQASAARVGDLNHSYKPRLEGKLPAPVEQMFEPLKYIEDLRPQYVRGPQTLTPQIARECRQAYDDIVARTEQVIGRAKEATS
jgi:hypothetical protein